MAWGGDPLFRHAGAHGDDTPGLAADCGARIVGGCCGNSPAHVAAMRRGLDAHKTGARPDVEAIVAALGPLVAPPAAETGASRPRRRERA